MDGQRYRAAIRTIWEIGNKGNPEDRRRMALRELAARAVGGEIPTTLLNKICEGGRYCPWTEAVNAARTIRSLRWS